MSGHGHRADIGAIGASGKPVSGLDQAALRNLPG
jgi:hypothetical protein